MKNLYLGRSFLSPVAKGLYVLEVQLNKDELESVNITTLAHSISMHRKGLNNDWVIVACGTEDEMGEACDLICNLKY
jgi:hypothetical protein